MVRFPLRKRIFLFSSRSRLMHGLTQSHSQWVSKVRRPWRLTGVLHLVSKFRISGAKTPLPRMSLRSTQGKLCLQIPCPPARKVTPLRTPATWHVWKQIPHTSCTLRRLPDMHLTGESLARRLTTPLCQGRLADQYTPAGGRSLGALLFYMSSPGRTFGTRLRRNSVSGPQSRL